MTSINIATSKDSVQIYNLVKKTIKEIYPHFYPKGAVIFFLNHHSLKNIQKDITSGNVYVLIDENKIIGTITVIENEINRFFVLPTFQHKGFGTKLFEFAQNQIIEKKYTCIKLHASFAAKSMYIKHGYKDFEYRTLETKNKDFLCVDIMQKLI